MRKSGPGYREPQPVLLQAETWLRIARVPYEVVDTPDPRKGPTGKLPFIEDDGVRIANSSLIVDHLVKTRGVDPDARLDASQRAIALLVQRTLEEHYAFILAYTHLLRDEGWQHTRARFGSVPALVRPLVGSVVRGRIKKMLWQQGLLRHTHEEIIEAAVRDWRAVLTVMCDGPFFFGDEPTGVDAIVFGALATSVLTPIESPIRDFLRSQPAWSPTWIEWARASFPSSSLQPRGRAPHRRRIRRVPCRSTPE